MESLDSSIGIRWHFKAMGNPCTGTDSPRDPPQHQGLLQSCIANIPGGESYFSEPRVAKLLYSTATRINCTCVPHCSHRKKTHAISWVLQHRYSRSIRSTTATAVSAEGRSSLLLLLLYIPLDPLLYALDIYLPLSAAVRCQQILL